MQYCRATFTGNTIKKITFVSIFVNGKLFIILRIELILAINEIWWVVSIGTPFFQMYILVQSFSAEIPGTRWTGPVIRCSDSRHQMYRPRHSVLRF